MCKNKDFCRIVIPSENYLNYYVLEFNQNIKSDRTLYIIYTDIESLIKKQMDVQTTQKILNQNKWPYS